MARGGAKVFRGKREGGPVSIQGLAGARGALPTRVSAKRIYAYKVRPGGLTSPHFIRLAKAVLAGGGAWVVVEICQEDKPSVFCNLQALGCMTDAGGGSYLNNYVLTNFKYENREGKELAVHVIYRAA